MNNIDVKDIRTILVDMPPHIKAYTVLMNDVYTVVLNARLSQEQNQESARHEIAHIQRGDYEKTSTADLIEFFAHEE